MSRTTTHPQPSELTPELADKLRNVEREFELLWRSSSTRHKWYLLSFIPRGAQVLSILALMGSFIAAVLFISARSTTALGTQPADAGAFALQFLGSSIGAALSLLISIWAFRYCQARADGKL